MNLITRLPHSPDWRSWGPDDWSTCLFRHLFEAEHTTAPVVHVPATRFDLKRAVADYGADAAEVERAFVRALKASPARTREVLSTRSPEFRASLREDVPPGYVAYLVLTCLAAAGGDEGTLTEGQFRERLRLTLGHPAGTSYDLADLGTLWEAFAHWLNARAAAGRFRSLHLPDPGRATRIGHSLRLAFPTIRDRRALADVFADLRGEAPSMREAVRRARERRAAFGERSYLPAVLDDFAERLASDGLGLGDHPFWTAVRDAVSLDYATPATVGVRLGLVVDEPAALDLSVYLACADLPAGLMPPPGVWLERLPVELGGFQKVVHFEAGPDPVATLLAGRAGTHWSLLAATPLFRAAGQGAILFTRDERHWPVSRISLPDIGADVWLLARDSLLAQILALVPGDGLHQSTPSVYAGWSWAGPFDAVHLHGLANRFPNVGCLQPVVPPPSVRLGGGARVGTAYLGVPGALPHVTAPAAADVVRMDPATGREAVLVARGAGRFEDIESSPVRGTVVYAARDAEGRTTGRARAEFVGAQVGVEYKVPAGAWRTEGSSAETVPRCPKDVCPSASYPEGEPPLPVVPGTLTVPLDFSVLLGGHALCGDIPLVGPALHTRCLVAFVEVVAALSSTRAGLAEANFLRLLRDVLGVPEGPALWGTARAWVEAGHVDTLTPQAWPNRIYVARRPTLVSWNGEHGPHATLTGLAPAEVRTRVATHARALGGHVVERPSASPWVMDPVVVELPSAAALTRLAILAELPPPVPLTPANAFGTPPSVVVANAEEAPPDRLTRQGVWDWGQGHFGRPAATAVALSRWMHPRSPTWYVVETAAGTERRVGTRAFRSRTWAFLYALALRGEPALVAESDGLVVTTGPTPAHLPLPVARSLACVGGAPGPRRRSDGRVEYVVPTTPGSFGDLSAWLLGRRTVPVGAVTLARQLAPRLGSVDPLGVPVPQHLADRLRPYAHDADVARVLGALVPAPLMPHVARLASALEPDA